MLKECDPATTGLEYDNSDQCNDCVKVGHKAFTVDGAHRCYAACNENSQLTSFCHAIGVF